MPRLHHPSALVLAALLALTPALSSCSRFFRFESKPAPSVAAEPSAEERAREDRYRQALALAADGAAKRDAAILAGASGMLHSLAEEGYRDSREQAAKVDGLRRAEAERNVEAARKALDKKDLLAAARTYRAALEFWPEQAEARTFLLDDAGKLGAARDAALAKAKVASRRRDHEAAASLYRAVLGAYPDQPEAREKLAEVEAKRREAGRESFARGKAAFERGDFAEAYKRFNQARDRGWQEAEAREYAEKSRRRLKLGDLYGALQEARQAGEWERVEALAGDILAVDGGYRDVRAALAEAQARLRESSGMASQPAPSHREGGAPGATQEAGAEEPAKPDAAAIYREGVELYSRKEYSAALQRFLQVERLEPGYKDVVVYVKRCRAILETLSETKP